MKQTQNSSPEWYWTRGLHDANIISATKKESDWNPTDNCLILKSYGFSDILFAKKLPKAIPLVARQI